MKSIGSKSLKTAIHKQLQKDKVVEMQARMIIEKQFKTAHAKLMSEFHNHPVTKELKSGPNSSNISGGLSFGNLFGFIGFNSKQNPIDAIDRALSSAHILIKKRTIAASGIVWTYAVNIPSLQELYKLTPMPWARGMSWLQEIEGLGIPNLGQYLYKESSASRSTAGIQSGSKSSGRIKIPYIKPILKEFEKNINSISSGARISKKYFK